MVSMSDAKLVQDNHAVQCNVLRKCMRLSHMTDGQTEIHSIHVNMPLYGYEGTGLLRPVQGKGTWGVNKYE